MFLGVGEPGEEALQGGEEVGGAPGGEGGGDEEGEEEEGEDGQADGAQVDLAGKGGAEGDEVESFGDFAGEETGVGEEGMVAYADLPEGGVEGRGEAGSLGGEDVIGGGEGHAGIPRGVPREEAVLVDQGEEEGVARSCGGVVGRTGDEEEGGAAVHGGEEVEGAGEPEGGEGEGGEGEGFPDTVAVVVHEDAAALVEKYHPVGGRGGADERGETGKGGEGVSRWELRRARALSMSLLSASSEPFTVSHVPVRISSSVRLSRSL